MVNTLQLRPTMLFMELKSTNWINSGTLLNTSRSSASGKVIRGATARSQPKITPTSVPTVMAAKVNSRVVQAPCSRYSRSCCVRLVSNMCAPLITEQAPADDAGTHHDDFGDEVIERCRQGKELERSERAHVQLLGDAGEVIVEAHHHAGGRHQYRPHHLVTQGMEHHAQ